MGRVSNSSALALAAALLLTAAAPARAEKITLRLADGPDEVHKLSIARRELAPHISREG